MRILYIDSNPKTAEYSHSKWAGEYLLNKIEGHTIEIWPIYRMDIPVIDEDVMSAWGKLDNGAELTLEELRKIKIRADVLEAFISFDHYIFVSPLWNFGVPPQLKALIDCISVVNKTFKYTENGAVGLLTGKSFVSIQASGGSYPNEFIAHSEFGQRYLSYALNYLGIEEKMPLFIQGTNMESFDRKVFLPELEAWSNEHVKELI